MFLNEGRNFVALMYFECVWCGVVIEFFVWYRIYHWNFVYFLFLREIFAEWDVWMFGKTLRKFCNNLYASAWNFRFCAKFYLADAKSYLHSVSPSLAHGFVFTFHLIIIFPRFLINFDNFFYFKKFGEKISNYRFSIGHM